MSDLKFDVVELQKIKLEPGDVLSVKLIGDDMGPEDMDSLRAFLNQVFKDNKVLLFTMPRKSDIVFEAIQQPQAAEGCSTTNYCNDCNCGKKEQALGEKA